MRRIVPVVAAIAALIGPGCASTGRIDVPAPGATGQAHWDGTVARRFGRRDAVPDATMLRGHADSGYRDTPVP